MFLLAFLVVFWEGKQVQAVFNQQILPEVIFFPIPFFFLIFGW